MFDKILIGEFPALPLLNNKKN